MIQISYILYDYDIKKSGLLTFANKHNKKLPKKATKKTVFLPWVDRKHSVQRPFSFCKQSVLLQFKAYCDNDQNGVRSHNLGPERRVTDENGPKDQWPSTGKSLTTDLSTVI